jgi:membrane-bound lytic murein transglycosylase B
MSGDVDPRRRAGVDPRRRAALRRLARGTLALAGLSAGSAAPAWAAKARRATRVALAASPAADDVPTYAAREDVMQFADAVAARRGLDGAWVRGALGQARFQPVVARLVMPAPAGAAKNWAAYRARFVEPVRIRAGLAFWDANARWLARAEDVFGVPPEIVVGIVGVETIYGRQTGTFRVLDSLSTLAFDFPAGRSDRSAFFRDELEAFLVMCRTEARDPLQVTGSYAGAMGLPQFMPSSFNRWAVDFDGDGRTDLDASAADVIGSVGLFLAEHGWKRGLKPRYPVVPPDDPAERALLLGPDIVPTFTLAEMSAHGARARAPDLPEGEKLALVQVENGDAPPSHVAGTANFYAVTRYNQSSYYALAVIELGETIKRAMGAAPAASGPA